jgi:hypothetical protein
MERKPSLTLVAQPQEFFRELVTVAIERRKVETKPETEFYLVNLLNQFMTTDRLYARDADGQMKDEPLAFLWKDALEEPNREHQRAVFRQVGDVSLYMAGFFQESLSRRLVDVDYYIELGARAYSHVAARADESIHRSLYGELSEKFGSFVDVLADAREQTLVGSPEKETDLLRCYELWVKTGSERAAEKLRAAGMILPVPSVGTKKGVQ